MTAYECIILANDAGVGIYDIYFVVLAESFLQSQSEAHVATASTRRYNQNFRPCLQHFPAWYPQHSHEVETSPIHPDLA